MPHDCPSTTCLQSDNDSIHRRAASQSLWGGGAFNWRAIKFTRNTVYESLLLLSCNGTLPGLSICTGRPTPVSANTGVAESLPQHADGRK